MIILGGIAFSRPRRRRTRIVTPGAGPIPAIALAVFRSFNPEPTATVSAGCAVGVASGLKLNDPP